jgi:DNA polymerase-1
MTQTLWEIESDFIRLMKGVKATGIKVDIPFCIPKIIEGTKICNEIREELGWNPGSPDQIARYLLDELKLPIVRLTEKGKPSMDKFAMEQYEEMLEPLQDETAQMVLRYRGWQKTVSSNYQAYVDLCDSDDVIHPNYKLHGARTCRISCEKPNLQQIPRSSPKEWNGALRRAFIARHGETKLWDFDFSQLEFRLAAAYAKEWELLAIFNDPTADIFQEMANRLGWERQDVKTLVYATLYGAGVKKLALIFGISRYEAVARLEEFHSTWPGFREKTKLATALAKSDGYIEYWTGRRRHLARDEAHKAFNSLIQGGAFEIVKRQMLRARGWPMVLQVHDSVTVEGDSSLDLNELKMTLQSVPESKDFGVNFKVDVKEWK